MANTTTRWCPLEYAYPVGCIYTSFNSTNPKDLFKFGEWEEIVDRFLYCTKLSEQSKRLGGSSTHKLTINELPKHSHKNDSTFVLTFNDGTNRNDFQDVGNKYNEGIGDIGYRPFDNRILYKETEQTGGDEPFSIMPPYVTCYAWTRIK